MVAGGDSDALVRQASDRACRSLPVAREGSARSRINAGERARSASETILFATRTFAADEAISRDSGLRGEIWG